MTTYWTEDVGFHVPVASDVDGVEVTILADGRTLLSWGDGVANAWDENWPTPDVALLRLAVLARCARSGWDRGFRHHWHDPAQRAAFVERAERVLTELLTEPLGGTP